MDGRHPCHAGNRQEKAGKLTGTPDREGKQAVIYTNFEDEMGEVIEVEETQSAHGGINLERFRQKTTEFLRARENDLVIQKLRHREALTEGDLEELQKVLVEQGVGQGRGFADPALERAGTECGRVCPQYRGTGQKGASEPFARFLDQANFNARQIRFVEMIVDFVTRNGKLEAKQLYGNSFYG